MKEKNTIAKEKNRLLQIARASIPYIKELKNLPSVKSTNACILMQQLEYWLAKYPTGFYKFQTQPNSIQYAYKEGDSWTEELGISEEEFRTAFDQIGVRYNSKKEFDQAKETGDVFCGKYYCSYFNKVSRLTFYFRNNQKVEEAIDVIAGLQKSISENANLNPTESTISFPRDEEYQFIEDEFVYPESTEITTKNISDNFQERELSDDNQNSLLNNNFDIEKEDINNQFSDVIDDVESFDNSGIDCSHYSAPSHRAEKILIPLDFAPTLEAQYKAINKFPKVSPAYVTEKLIRDSREQGKKKTISEWHFKWWDWMNTERPSPNNTDLESEHSAIINKVMNDIYDASFDCGKYVFRYEDVSDYLKDDYSTETVTEAIQRLFIKDIFVRVGDYYFNYEECQNSAKSYEKVKEQILYLRLEEQPLKVFSQPLLQITFKEVWNRERNVAEKSEMN